MVKNFLLKKTVRALRSWLPKHPVKQRVLVVATTALGDTLWATPALETLRRSFPSLYLAVLTSPIGREILQHNPHIDRLFMLEEPLSLHFFSLWKTLYREKFDTVLILHASQRLILPLSSLLGASRLIGTAGINKGLDALLTDPLPNEAQHEITRRLKIVAHYGARRFVETLSFFLQPKEKLPPRSPGPWIALHPGSKDSFKRWPAERFAALGRQLKERFSCEILLTGSREEKELMEKIAKEIPGAELYETGSSLRQFAALLEQMDLLITNDTGPFHLACALQRPVLGLYAATDPALCGPHQAERARVISRRNTCDPCLKRKCRQPFCFLQIGVADVLAAVKDMLG